MAILARKSGLLISGSITSTRIDGTMLFKPVDQKTPITVKPENTHHRVFSNGESLEQIEAWINGN